MLYVKVLHRPYRRVKLSAIAALKEACVLVVLVAKVASASMVVHVCFSSVVTQKQHRSWDWVAPL